MRLSAKSCVAFLLVCCLLLLSMTWIWSALMCFVTAGIVSKRQNITENFLHPLVARRLSLWDLLCRYQIPKGTPSARAINTRGWENLAIFDGNRRLSRKRCEIGRRLLWNVNRKSLVPDRMVSFSMTLSDPNPGFKVAVYLQVEYLKNGVF